MSSDKYIGVPESQCFLCFDHVDSLCTRLDWILTSIYGINGYQKLQLHSHLNLQPCYSRELHQLPFCCWIHEAHAHSVDQQIEHLLAVRQRAQAISCRLQMFRRFSAAIPPMNCRHWRIRKLKLIGALAEWCPGFNIFNGLRVFKNLKNDLAKPFPSGLAQLKFLRSGVRLCAEDAHGGYAKYRCHQA